MRPARGRVIVCPITGDRKRRQFSGGGVWETLADEVTVRNCCIRVRHVQIGYVELLLELLELEFAFHATVLVNKMTS